MHNYQDKVTLVHAGWQDKVRQRFKFTVDNRELTECGKCDFFLKVQSNPFYISFTCNVWKIEVCSSLHTHTHTQGES